MSAVAGSSAWLAERRQLLRGPDVPTTPSSAQQSSISSGGGSGGGGGGGGGCSGGSGDELTRHLGVHQRDCKLAGRGLRLHALAAVGRWAERRGFGEAAAAAEVPAVEYERRRSELRAT